MGDDDPIAASAEIVEGKPIPGKTLAALIVWGNHAYPPLLRINPALVSEDRRDGVIAWARRVLSEGRTMAFLRADDATTT